MTTAWPGHLAVKSMKVAALISQSLRETNQSVAVAESLTSGSLACHLGASSKWLLGGIIAYSSEVKFALLGVDRGPVITARCAGQMAAGVAGLTGADLSIAVTGAGGPGPEEGNPAGTVFIAVHSSAGTHVEEHHFSQEPGDVVQATLRALQMLQEVVHHPGPATDRS